MARLLRLAAAAVLVLAVGPPPAAAQCPPNPPTRVDQETYLRIADKTFVYVDDINSNGTDGWSPFRVLVVTGLYRDPFVLAKGFMRRGDVEALFKGRSDVVQQTIAVPGHDAKKTKAKPTFGPTLDVKTSKGVLKVRVTDVRPVRGFRSIDYLFLEACGR